MSLNSFTFNGKDSWDDFGVYIGGQGTYNAPQKVFTKTSIPGRNGDLLRDEGRFSNAFVTYNIVVMHEFRDKTDDLRAWLLSPNTYVRLEDTYHPDEYRMAIVSGGIDFETSAYNLTGRTQVTFDCKPQRFLKSGENTITLSASGTVTNPTLFDSKPLITVFGNGTCSFTLRNKTVTITDVSSYVVIDSESMNAYKGATSMNDKVTLSDEGFPVLIPGNNGVTLGGNTTKLEIVGRWWTV